MLESFIPQFSLSNLEWTIVIICAALIGMSKTGLAGAGMLVVPLMATIFGGKQSTGIVLPLLSMADLFAVWYYHRHANWSYVLKLLPWTVIGVLVGLYVGNSVSDAAFKDIMGGIVLLSVVILVWRDVKKDVRIPSGYMFPVIMGLAGGFATMVGNAAGAIMALYLLSMRLPKNSFIGTGAWFFLIINLFKVPFHITVWETINLDTFTFDLILFPVIAAGAFLGIYIVKLIPEKGYRIFILVSTAISAIVLLIK